MSFRVCLYMRLFEHRQAHAFPNSLWSVVASSQPSTVGSCSRDHVTDSLHHSLSVIVTFLTVMTEAAFWLCFRGCRSLFWGRHRGAWWRDRVAQPHPTAADRSRSSLEAEAATTFKGPSLLIHLPPPVQAYISLLGFRCQSYACFQKKTTCWEQQTQNISLGGHSIHANQNFWKIGCSCTGWLPMHKP